MRPTKKIKARQRGGASVTVLLTIAAAFCLVVIPASATAAAPELIWQSPPSGEAGSGAGQQDHPSGGIAADSSSGHVYVGDAFNARVDEFDAWGQFVKSWGWGVANGAAELQSCGPGATPPTATCQAGLEGSGPGQFFDIQGGVEVDAAGNIYVGDLKNHRIEKFDSNGKFLLMFGKEVDKGPNHPGNVCTAAYIAEGDSCGAGVKGSGAGEFETEVNSADYIALGPAGTIFVGEKGRIQEFEPNGSFKSQVALELKGEAATQFVEVLDVDPTGNFYITLTEGPGAGPKPNVLKLSSSGPLLSTFTTEGLPAAIALDAVGNLYVDVEYDGYKRREVIEFGPGGAPIIAQGSGFAMSVGSASDDGGAVIAGLATNTVTAAGGTDIYLAATSAHTISYVRSYGSPPDKWAPPLFPPEIKSQYAISVDADVASVGAQINPRFWADATYYVEYGTGKCSEGGCANQLPAPPGTNLGAGVVATPAATSPVVLPGLTPATTYHYRFVAESSGGGPVYGVGPGEAEATFITPSLSLPPNANCPNQVFRTGASAKLPDCRAYEMVSPVDKNNTDIVSLINVQSDLVALNQSAVAGEKITYTTSQGFGDAQGVPYVSQYIASRGVNGWQSHGITAPQGFSPIPIGKRIDLEFRAFTDDLCASALYRTTDPPLAQGATEGFANLYLRHNCGEESYETVTNSEPPNLPPAEFQPVIQGLSSDGRCTAFYADDQLTPDANPGSNRQLYESCGGQLRLISVLPSGKASKVGASIGTGNQDSLGIRTANLVNAVSDDGSRIYWTANNAGAGPLYVRVNAEQEQSEVSAGKCTEEEKACTIKVSESISKDPAHFWAAAADGSRAFFTSEGQLYEFDLETKGATPIASQVPGMIGAGEEASHLYFLSREALTPGATAGEPNLYLREKAGEGTSIDFIATLSATDVTPNFASSLSPANFEPFKKTSRVSPDGRHVAFMSNASLTGYDNTDVQTGEADGEVYTYNAEAGELSCVSCNPTGQRPTGRQVKVEGFLQDRVSALLPPYVTELYGSRVLSEDGQRVFFNSYEALLPRDTNGKADVYQWEAPGSGDCSEKSIAFSASNDGCLSLISSGESPTDSEFVDASADGTDVFFTTASSLVAQDPGLIDIYDARAGGGYPPPPGQPASCEGEACQGPLAPPNDPTPASSAFEGAGNVVEKQAKKKKTAHKRKHAKKHVAKKHKRANHKGRAGR